MSIETCGPLVHIHRGFEQRSQEWHDVRRGKVTGTGFAKVLDRTQKGAEGASRRAYRTQLVIERLTGCSMPGLYITQAMQWGMDQEPFAVRAYLDRHTICYENFPAFVERTDITVGVSPDGLLDENGLLEIKCLQAPNHLDYIRRRSLPAEYVPQVQGSLWVTERNWCDFVSYNPMFPTHLQLLVVRVWRDDKYIAMLEHQVALFLAEVEMEVESLKVLTL